MRRLLGIWTLAIFCLALGACRHQPLAYTLNQRILTPPASKPEIKNARRKPVRKTGCDVQSESYSVAWRGNTARLTAKIESLIAPPSPAQTANAPVSIRETGERIPVDSLAQLETFRDALAASEDSGCLRNDEDARLRAAMTETFPFPPQLAVFLRYGTFQRTGYIDLIPGFVLKTVTPTGAAPDISFHVVTPVAGIDRVRIALTSGGGKALAIPETPSYFRYLYWTGGSTHRFRTTILGVQERKMLRTATDAFLSDPEGFCAKPTAGVFCQSIVVTVGMNAGFYVRVNGQDSFVRLGANVLEGINDAMPVQRGAIGPRPPPHVQSFRRLYRGKLIPVRFEGNEILGVTLMPGDEITQ